jgi:hypothetical protein
MRSDSISLTISDYFHSTGYSFSQRLVTVRADTVFVDIRISFAGGFQSDVVIPWGVRACIPPRPEGTLIVSVAVERESRFGGVIAYRQTYPVSVTSEGSSDRLRLAWLGRGAFSEVLGDAHIGGNFVLGILPMEDWSGDTTRLWLSFDPPVFSVEEASTSLSEGCQGTFHPVDEGHAVAEVGCAEWTAFNPVLSFEVTLSDQFSNWADIQMDSLEILGDRKRVGSIARLTERTRESFLEMDFTNDNRVDFHDLYIFADSFGFQNTFFDFNESGKVDFDDFFLFADSFGTVREP